jgi:ATP-dependent DNA helicase PIF1
MTIGRVQNGLKSLLACINSVVKSISAGSFAGKSPKQCHKLSNLVTDRTGMSSLSTELRAKQQRYQIMFLYQTRKRMARKSVFFAGAAGTGKSYILKVLRDVLDSVGFADKISFTAPTGVAACNIRGLTIHAWAGVGMYIRPHY